MGWFGVEDMRLLFERQPVQFMACTVMLLLMLDATGTYAWFFGSIFDWLKP